jgi:hypothetical protein
MFAKKEWFQRRKYGGWGITPKTKEAWLYLLFMIVPFIVFHFLPFWTDQVRIYVTVIWLLILLIDIIPIMMTVKKDELEFKIEALSERNAAWFMSMVLAFGLLYEAIIHALKGEIYFNIVIVVALFGGALVKSISNYILEKKGIKN